MIGTIGDTPRIAGAAQPVSIGEAARAFEALFLETLLSQANRPLPGVETPLSGGSAERSYRQLFLQEVAGRVAAGPAARVAPDATPAPSPLGFATQILAAQRRGEGAR